MRNIFEWFRGWYKTLEIKFKNPELYHWLCSCTDTAFDEDFVEVEPPRYRTWAEYKAEQYPCDEEDNRG
jgi:hypothetical protein